MEQQFVSILKGALFAPWFWLSVAPLCLLVYNHIAYRCAKAKKKAKKMAARRNDMKKGLVLLVIALAVGALFAPDVIEDISNRSFCTVHGDFEKGYSSTGGGVGHSYYTVTTDDGEEFEIRRPLDLWPFERADLPEDETFHGTMWYSENSHYALKFVPDTD